MLLVRDSVESNHSLPFPMITLGPVRWSISYIFAKALFARMVQVGSEPVIPRTDNSLNASLG